MARTTDELVKAIIAVEPGKDISPFIDAANKLVTRCCTGGQVAEAYDEDTLVVIETWLSAHFYCMYDPQYVSEEARSVQARYETKIDKGLDLSKYGQMAKTQDWQGGLAELDAQTKEGIGRTVGVIWLGTDLTEDEY
jgi:hypothetical protein